MRNLILSTLSTLALLIYPLSLSAQNSFSISVDVDGAAGDQAVTSLNVSADQVVAIQIFALSNLTNLTYLDLYSNITSDVSALSNPTSS